MIVVFWLSNCISTHISHNFDKFWLIISIEYKSQALLHQSCIVFENIFAIFVYTYHIVIFINVYQLLSLVPKEAFIL